MPPVLARGLGPLLMVVATGSYIVNDTLMKLATEGLPPYEVLALRGVAATLWGLPAVAAVGAFRALPLVFERSVVRRNLCEILAILCYVVALANMPIADAIALGQVTPLIVILGSALVFGERVGGLRLALIGLGFVGAVMVAQPTGAGISIFAVLALGNAGFSALRDIASRLVPARIPGMIVALSAAVLVMLAAAGMHLALETPVRPGPRHLALLAGAGFFLVIGHLSIFSAYRIGPTASVAPFFYSFTLWAMLSGIVVFGELPNPLALAGIALVLASGLAIVLLDGWRRRAAPRESRAGMVGDDGLEPPTSSV